MKLENDKVVLWLKLPVRIFCVYVLACCIAIGFVTFKYDALNVYKSMQAKIGGYDNRYEMLAGIRDGKFSIEELKIYLDENPDAISAAMYVLAYSKNENLSEAEGYIFAVDVFKQTIANIMSSPDHSVTGSQEVKFLSVEILEMASNQEDKDYAIKLLVSDYVADNNMVNLYQSMDNMKNWNLVLNTYELLVMTSLS